MLCDVVNSRNEQIHIIFLRYLYSSLWFACNTVYYICMCYCLLFFCLLVYFEENAEVWSIKLRNTVLTFLKHFSFSSFREVMCGGAPYEVSYWFYLNYRVFFCVLHFRFLWIWFSEFDDKWTWMLLIPNYCLCWTINEKREEMYNFCISLCYPQEWLVFIYKLF